MTQISGPGAAPATMTGGPVEDHDEPQVIGPDSFKVVTGVEGDPDDKLGVVYDGTDEQAATDAFDQADPGAGFVQLLRNGEAVEAKRAEPQVLDLGSLPTVKYAVVRGQAAAGDGGEPVNALLEVVYQGDDMDAANAAFQSTDPGDGFVKFFEDGDAVITKGTETLADPGTPPEPKPGEQASAFDAKKFVGPRPQVNDEEVDKIKVTFTGTWELDPMVAEDVAFWNRLAFGQSLDLRVEAEIVDIAGKYHRNAETDEETITGVAKAKVLHVKRLTPEEL